MISFIKKQNFFVIFFLAAFGLAMKASDANVTFKTTKEVSTFKNGALIHVVFTTTKTDTQASCQSHMTFERVHGQNRYQFSNVQTKAPALNDDNLFNLHIGAIAQFCIWPLPEDLQRSVLVHPIPALTGPLATQVVTVTMESTNEMPDAAPADTGDKKDKEKTKD